MISRAGVIGISALIVLGACSEGGSKPASGTAKEPTHITVSVAQAQDINGLLWNVGIEQGFFEKHGVIVDKVIPAEGGGTTLQNVIAGKLPFGQVATAAVVNGYREGLPVKIIGGATEVPYEIGWGVAANSRFKTVDDLKNTTWGFTNAGSVTEAMSYLVPEAAKLDTKSIKRVSTGGVGAGIALLQSGAVDVTFIPPLTALEHKKDVRVILQASEVLPSYELTVMVTAREYAEKNPDVAKGMLAGAQDAIEWIYANPDKAGERYAKMAQVDVAAATEIIKKFIEVKVYGLAFNPEAFKAVEKGLQATDGIDSVDWGGLLTDAYLPEGHKGTIPGK
ncbi:hypothetical protein ASG74_15010 [Knoellia sp. Soil729]|nr:hypothetical protein ASG74_15010 [Knoellia sp. Soil729]